MLGMINYPKKYINACRSRVESDLSAYRNLVSAAGNNSAANKTQLNTALEAFEPSFFNNMVLLLDDYFVHRLRTVEGKYGNPLNEVRMLCTSMLNNTDIISADKTIKYDPAKSVLKYRVGDEIKLKETDFLLIFKAFFAEIEKRFI